MKKTSKRIFAALLSVLMVCTFASCGNDEGKSSSSENSSISDSAESESSADDSGAEASNTDADTDIDTSKEITLNLGLPGGYDVTSEEIVNSFKEKYPNIDLVIDDSPWGDFSKKISTQIAGNAAPDVWFQENATVLGYGELGAAMDLSELIAENINMDDYSDAIYSARVGDKIWGIPHGVNPIALGYNKAIFDDAGVDYPTDDWTYQDMLDTAEELKSDDVYGFITGGTITVGWYPWIRSAGGMALDEAKENAVFDDEKSIQGMTAWADTVKNGISPNLTEQNDLGGARSIFGNGKAAMIFLQYSELATDLNVNFPDLDYDTVMIPKTFDGSQRFVPSVANTWMINDRASDEGKEAAWLWIEHYLSDDVQEIIAQSGSTLPVKKEAFESVKSLEGNPANKEAYTEGVSEAGTTLDENAKWSEWRIAAQPIFEEILNGTKDPETGLKEIKEKVQVILDEA